MEVRGYRPIVWRTALVRYLIPGKSAGVALLLHTREDCRLVELSDDVVREARNAVLEEILSVHWMRQPHEIHTIDRGLATSLQNSLLRHDIEVKSLDVAQMPLIDAIRARFERDRGIHLRWANLPKSSKSEVA